MPPCARRVEIDMQLDGLPEKVHSGVSGDKQRCAWGVDGPPGATGVLSRGVPPVKGVWGAAPGSPPLAPIFWGFFD